jgi:hypothetical protein
MRGGTSVQAALKPIEPSQLGAALACLQQWGLVETLSADASLFLRARGT